MLFSPLQHLGDWCVLPAYREWSTFILLGGRLLLNRLFYQPIKVHYFLVSKYCPEPCGGLITSVSFQCFLYLLLMHSKNGIIAGKKMGLGVDGEPAWLMPLLNSPVMCIVNRRGVPGGAEHSSL